MDNHFSTSSAVEEPAGFGASSSDLGANGDLFEDSCSICLEPFTAQDPSTITTCKHEYHLQCILDWSQRSKECPICWRVLKLQDPNSQELVDAVGRERSTRSRISTASSGSLAGSREELGIGFDVPLDSEFDESIVQRVAAILSRGRDVRPREREGSTGLAQSGSPVFRSGMNFSQVQRTSETAREETHHLHVQSSDGSFSTSDVPIRFTMQPPSPVRPAAAQSPQVTQRPSSPENSSLSESLKSKFSSASARYKESISKGTKSLKERILARHSVKELSKGVQREMSAGFSRLIERLDLNPKQSGTSVSVPGGADPTVKSPTKGKGAQEGSTTNHESPYSEVCDLGTIPGRLEVVPSQGVQ